MNNFDDLDLFSFLTIIAILHVIDHVVLRLIIRVGYLVCRVHPPAGHGHHPRVVHDAAVAVPVEEDRRHAVLELDVLASVEVEADAKDDEYDKEQGNDDGDDSAAVGYRSAWDVLSRWYCETRQRK